MSELKAANDLTMDSTSVLLQLVGERVQNVRKQRGLSRRVLSEKSGVSPRYIAQLESGEGNISIGLLARISTALDYPIEWLVSDPPANINKPDVAGLVELLCSADEQTLARVTALLQSASPQRAQRICLIGLRGAGKSTLGRLVSEKLDVPFIELNTEIENLAGMPVAEIMALYGAEGYRDLEAQALATVVAQHKKVILAAAGGVVANRNSYGELLSQFHAIWIQASPTEHMLRVRAQGDTRPMKGNTEAMQQLQKLLSDREEHYRKALATVDTSGATVSDSVEELIRQIHLGGFLG